MYKTIFSLLTIILPCFSAYATIWITLADPESNKIAVVGASSGNIGNTRTMVAVDNYGIAVVGSWYLRRQNPHLRDLVKNEELSATELALEFSRLINRDRHKRRVSFVNARFQNASEPGRGCHVNNQYCGKYVEGRFSVTGGGLVAEEVILAAKDVLEDPTIQELPIECQMYKGIEAIFNAGGEYKLFNRLAYLVDDVTKKEELKIKVYYRGRGYEANLLKQFKRQIESLGIDCPESL